MISSVYSYYLSQYGNKSNSKYDSHTRTQLKNTYSKVVKINSQTPVYKLDLSTAAQKYAIDLKEHARALENITEDLSDGADGTMTFKKSAVSSNASAVNASYITDFGAASNDESFDINVKQLACSQLNTGNYLQPRSKHIKPGEYSFDLSINDVIYEFQFKVDNSETTNNIQNKIARLINRSNIGLTANIKEDSLGNTAINIESESTGINGTTPVIFSIKSDDANNQLLIDTLGLDRVTQYPSNAIFDVDGDERSSMSNSITINKAYDVKLIALLASPIPLASFCTSSATTAKPFPASPALAASMEALSASIFCRLLNPSINLTLSLAVASWLAAALIPVVSSFRIVEFWRAV